MFLRILQDFKKPYPNHHRNEWLVGSDYHKENELCLFPVLRSIGLPNDIPGVKG